MRDLSPWFGKFPDKTGEVWFEAEPALPILVKFLFTSENLSVQVHPGDREGRPGKTEMWHILRAGPGARIALGFREPLTRERVREAACSGEIEELLAWFPVTAGETYFTPAGTVHAIGAGIALCEIQQNTDITYRLYDYGRPRPLHLEQALEIANFAPHPGAQRAHPLGAGRSRLAECSHFTTELIETSSKLLYEPDPASFHLFITLAGDGKWNGGEFHPGEVWLIPESAHPFEIDPETCVRVLVTFVPQL